MEMISYISDDFHKLWLDLPDVPIDCFAMDEPPYQQWCIPDK